MSLTTAHVRITGVRPILWHHFTPDVLSPAKRERTGTTGNDPEEWKRTVLVDDQRRLWLPGQYIFSCIRDGAKHVKRGRGSIQSLVAATLQVLEDRIFTDRYLPEEKTITADPSQPVFLDIRSVRNPATKARNVRYRVAASPGWTLEFRLCWENTLVSRGEMEAVIIDAGQHCGLGDGRGIGFGRFRLDSFTCSTKAAG